MADKKYIINYEEFTSASQMTPQDQEMVAAAIDAQKGSYSPYSKFQVGAALKLENGLVLKGANSIPLRLLPPGDGRIPEKAQKALQHHPGGFKTHPQIPLRR